MNFPACCLSSHTPGPLELRVSDVVKMGDQRAYGHHHSTKRPGVNRHCVSQRIPTTPSNGRLGMLRRPLRSMILVSLLGLLASSGPAAAQEWLVSSQQHAWGRFKPGCWKTVRVITDILDGQGNVNSTTKTETTTTLLKKKGNSYTLEVEVTMEIGDRRIASEPKQIKRNFTINTDGKIRIKPASKSTVTFNGHTLPVDVLNVTLEDTNGRRASTVHSSRDTPPFVFRRETVMVNNENEQLYQTTVSVTEYGLAHKVLGETEMICTIHTVHRQDMRTITSDETYCADVPGGIISHRSEETNAAGQVMRRSTMELLDYGLSDKTSKRKGRRSDEAGDATGPAATGPGS
jgi:hypothetical protein